MPPETNKRNEADGEQHWCVRIECVRHAVVPSQLKVLIAEGTPIAMVMMRERERGVRAHAAHEHVVAPDHESEECQWP